MGDLIGGGIKFAQQLALQQQQKKLIEAQAKADAAKAKANKNAAARAGGGMGTGIIVAIVGAALAAVVLVGWMISRALSSPKAKAA